MTAFVRQRRKVDSYHFPTPASRGGMHSSRFVNVKSVEHVTGSIILRVEKEVLHRARTFTVTLLASPRPETRGVIKPRCGKAAVQDRLRLGYYLIAPATTVEPGLQAARTYCRIQDRNAPSSLQLTTYIFR